jgi:predicted transglutaminase-like cysteine proteinase
MTATQMQIAMLRAVNDQFNAIPYDAIPKAGEAPDTWKVAPDGGTFECRDYTIAKKDALAAQGWPTSDMSVVICWTEPVAQLGSGPDARERHAVLACNATDQIFILDNRTPDIYLWNEPVYPYVWEGQQIAGTDEFRPVGDTGLSFA